MYSSVCLLVGVTMVLAIPGYRDRIPNGHTVPDPCKPHQTWQTVGHTVSSIGLANFTNLNAFGQEFLAAHVTWTKHVCHRDNDGDGKTNGEELGDPHCTWNIGDTPEGSATGHPGINEKTVDCSGLVG